jgi:hypothetical protein
MVLPTERANFEMGGQRVRRKGLAAAIALSEYALADSLLV